MVEKRCKLARLWAPNGLTRKNAARQKPVVIKKFVVSADFQSLSLSAFFQMNYLKTADFVITCIF